MPECTTIIGWVNCNTGLIQSILVAALVGLTAFYAWQTKFLVGEARRSRQLQYRPQVVVYAGPPALFSGTPGAPDVPRARAEWVGSALEILLDIENIGLGPARDIVVQCVWNHRLYELRLEGMASQGKRHVGVWYLEDAEEGQEGLQVRIECKTVLGDEVVMWEKDFSLSDLRRRDVKIYDGNAVEVPYRL